MVKAKTKTATTRPEEDIKPYTHGALALVVEMLECIADTLEDKNQSGINEHREFGIKDYGKQVRKIANDLVERFDI